MLRELLIKHGKDDDRERCECNVIELIDDRLIHGLTTERGSESEPELRHNEKNILVEHIDGQDRVSAIGFTSMVEEK